MKMSDRLQKAPLSGIRKMFDLAGSGSINLSLGEPDVSPPDEAVRGMSEAAAKGLNRYGPTPGIMPLREAVAYRYKRHGIESGNVMITPSGTTALLMIAQSLIDPGDEALVPSPGFVVYGPHTALSSGRPIDYKLTDDGFQPDIDDIQRKITKRTKVVFLNYPSNPTGGILSEESFKAIRDISADKNIIIVSDEVYEPFVYEGEHISFMGELDNAIVVNGFSKMMAITGWRMGFVTAGKDVITDLTKMAYHVCASPNMPAQYGILSAMPAIDTYLDGVRRTYKRRRDLITSRISNIDGMDMDAPKGAFYAFPKFGYDMTSEELAMRLVKNGLICVPGSAFGQYGEGHLRFSYAADEDKISRGMDILEKVANGIKG
ncbi:MAG: pyridoxal phosphate-dependent aminotransferase [Methanomassiliicoccaceae archaeon]|jgi:aspartate aminotransferase|nr:pyridoxal phosphate-dependent aminotransferase [Methanomassiliicoccaceae archaeon]